MYVSATSLVHLNEAAVVDIDLLSAEMHDARISPSEFADGDWKSVWAQGYQALKYLRGMPILGWIAVVPLILMALLLAKLAVAFFFTNHGGERNRFKNPANLQEAELHVERR